MSPREHNVIEKMLALGADPVFRSTSESQNALEIIAGFERQDSWNCGVCRTKRELLERILRKGSIDQLSLDRALAAAFQGYADTSSYMQKSHDLADMIEVFVSHGANPSTALKYLESSVAAKILEVPGVDLAVQRGVMKYFQNNPQKLATIGKDGFYFTAPNARCEIQSFLQDDDSSNDGLFKLDFYLSAPGAENEQTWKIPVAMNLEGQAVSSESSCLVLSQKFKAQLRKMSQAGEKFKFEYEPVSDEKGAANVLRIVQADGTDNPVTPEVMNQYFLPLQHGGQFSENGARAR